MNTDKHEAATEVVCTQTASYYPPLELQTKPALSTDELCFYIGVRPQTARVWACKETGPIRPIRLPGSALLRWPTAEVKALLKVA